MSHQNEYDYSDIKENAFPLVYTERLRDFILMKSRKKNEKAIPCLCCLSPFSHRHIHFHYLYAQRGHGRRKALLQENILYSNSTILGEGDNFLRVKNAKSAKIKMANKQGDMDTLREVYFDKDGSVNTLTIYGQDHKVVQSIQKTNRGWTSETRNYLTDETGRIIISHGINGDTTHFFYNKKSDHPK